MNQFLRFCVVGGLCTVVDAAIFYVVIQSAPYTVALVSGYCISLLLNYYLTIKWTFKVKSSYHNAIGVISAHLFNLFVVRMGLMYLFVDCLSLNEQIAFFPTLLISVVSNYLIIRFIIKAVTPKDS